MLPGRRVVALIARDAATSRTGVADPRGRGRREEAGRRRVDIALDVDCDVDGAGAVIDVDVTVSPNAHFDQHGNDLTGQRVDVRNAESTTGWIDGQKRARSRRNRGQVDHNCRRG